MDLVVAPAAAWPGSSGLGCDEIAVQVVPPIVALGRAQTSAASSAVLECYAPSPSGCARGLASCALAVTTVFAVQLHGVRIPLGGVRGMQTARLPAARSRWPQSDVKSCAVYANGVRSHAKQKAESVACE